MKSASQAQYAVLASCPIPQITGFFFCSNGSRHPTFRPPAADLSAGRIHPIGAASRELRGAGVICEDVRKDSANPPTRADALAPKRSSLPLFRRLPDAGVAGLLPLSGRLSYAANATCWLVIEHPAGSRSRLEWKSEQALSASSCLQLFSSDIVRSVLPAWLALLAWLQFFSSGDIPKFFTGDARVGAPDPFHDGVPQGVRSRHGSATAAPRQGTNPGGAEYSQNAADYSIFSTQSAVRPELANAASGMLKTTVFLQHLGGAAGFVAGCPPRQRHGSATAAPRPRHGSATAAPRQRHGSATAAPRQRHGSATAAERTPSGGALCRRAEGVCACGPIPACSGVLSVAD
eukprot:gene17891-biopygen12847